MSKLTRSLRWLRGNDLGSASFAAKLSVSWTVKEPMRASSCSTYEFSFRNVATEVCDPLVRTLPSTVAPDAAARCARTLRRVLHHVSNSGQDSYPEDEAYVLPEPEGPMSASSSPRGSQKRLCSTEGRKMPQTSFDMTIDTGENQLRFFRSMVLDGDTDRIPSKSLDDVVDEE